MQEEKAPGRLIQNTKWSVIGLTGVTCEVVEQITGRLSPLALPPRHLLGYDVVIAGGYLLAIRHGLFGLAQWLDEFCADVNEYGLFPTPALADRFRQAYRMSPSQEKGEPCIHELFLPETDQIEAAVQS